MKKNFWYISVIILPLILACSIGEKRLVIVENGKERSVILIADSASKPVRRAARELQEHVQKATGAQLQIRQVSERDQLPEGICQILIGPSILTDKLGLYIDDLEPEQFRIHSDDQHLVFLGHDIENSPSTMWAVCDFLDWKLGVRWLWPGEIGTHIPKQESIILKEPIDITDGPELLKRRLWYHKFFQHSNYNTDARTWLLRHRMGS